VIGVRRYFKKVFFNESTLFKLYHRENVTEELMSLFNDTGIEVIYLAEVNDGKNIISKKIVIQ